MKRSYNGGKAQAGTYQKIINQIPPHDIFIEAFAGSAAILRAIRPARHSYALDLDQNVIDRLRGTETRSLTALCGDAIQFLQQYDWQGREFIYCDPPYVMSARRSQRPIYKYEFTDEQHHALLSVLKRIPAKVCLSGYYSDLYNEALSDWRVVTFQAVTRGGSLATEYLWCNYAEPTELHDYSFLGEDFRERERIKRKVTRWTRRLERMPTLEQYALRAAIAKFGDAGRTRQM